MAVSRLCYCHALYVRLLLKSVQILQLVQNAAAGIFTGVGCRDYMNLDLAHLHWLLILLLGTIQRDCF